MTWARLVPLAVFSSLAGIADSAKFSNCDNGEFQKCYMRCTANACDTVPPLGDVGEGAAVYTTDSSGNAMERNNLEFTSSQPSSWSHWQHIEVNTSARFQTMEGFGGAFTDSVSINLQKMSEDVRRVILSQYFGADGAAYSIGRVPIGSCDFSNHSYSYIEDGDVTTDTFALTVEDTGPIGKIQLITEAKKQAPNGLKLFASVWSAPPWMKTGMRETDTWVAGALSENSTLRSTWAMYFSKFISAYKRHGIDIWAVTVQNEPKELPGILQQSWETMFYTSQQQAEFIGDHLGPQLRRDHPDVKIIIHDDQKMWLPAVKDILADEKVRQYVDGVGMHWYMFPGQMGGKVQETHDWLAAEGMGHVFLLGTEACAGFSAVLTPPHTGPELGSFFRAGSYSSDIITDVNAWTVGWTDWNLVLDMSGGPNHAGNVVDAPILVDPADPDVFYKQPLFYTMAHFSHFITPGSVRIGVTSGGPLSLECAGFLRPDGLVVLVIANNNEFNSKDFYVRDGARGYLQLHLHRQGIQTVVYRPAETDAVYV